jgi:hypothetical protein
MVSPRLKSDLQAASCKSRATIGLPSSRKEGANRLKVFGSTRDNAHIAVSRTTVSSSFREAMTASDHPVQADLPMTNKAQLFVQAPARFSATAWRRRPARPRRVCGKRAVSRLRRSCGEMLSSKGKIFRFSSGASKLSSTSRACAFFSPAFIPNPCAPYE